MDVCLRVVMKESNKSRFDSYRVRNSLLIISHISFRDCRVHTFFRQPNLEKAVDVRCREETVVERQKCEPVGNRAFYAQLYLTISQLSPSTEITNLSVGCAEFQISCRLLASEKTDGQYIV